VDSRLAWPLLLVLLARAGREQRGAARYQDRETASLPPGSGFLAILAARRAYSTCQARSSVYGGRAPQPGMRVPTIPSTAGSSISVGTGLTAAMASVNLIVVSRLSRVRAARAGGAQNRVDRLVGGADGHRPGDLTCDRPARQIEGRHSRTSGPNQPVLHHQSDPAGHGAAHSHPTVKEFLTQLPLAADGAGETSSVAAHDPPAAWDEHNRYRSLHRRGC
jgi:hypothetical protein